MRLMDGFPDVKWVFFENVLSGRWQGLPVTEADYRFTIDTLTVREIWTPYGSPEISTPGMAHHRFSVVIADLPAAVPCLLIHGGSWINLDWRAGPWDFDSGSAKLNHMFKVLTFDRAFAAKLIDAGMIEWLLATGAAFAFDFQDRYLLVWCPLLQATALAGLFDAAKSFIDHIPRQIWAEYGTG